MFLEWCRFVDVNAAHHTTHPLHHAATLLVPQTRTLIPLAIAISATGFAMGFMDVGTTVVILKSVLLGSCVEEHVIALQTA